MTKQAFAYYRTSSATNVSAKDKDGDKPKKKGLSEDKDSRVRQELAVRDYASANDIEIVGEFYDAAVSGADMIHARPGFDAMLKAILGNGVRTILIERHEDGQETTRETRPADPILMQPITLQSRWFENQLILE